MRDATLACSICSETIAANDPAPHAKRDGVSAFAGGTRSGAIRGGPRKGRDRPLVVVGTRSGVARPVKLETAETPRRSLHWEETLLPGVVPGAKLDS
jgi:hypothetical protein